MESTILVGVLLVLLCIMVHRQAVNLYGVIGVTWMGQLEMRCTSICCSTMISNGQNTAYVK